MKLTIGMPACSNYTEVWFSVQALRLYQDLSDTEILVVDTSPDGDDQKAAETFLRSWAARDARYVRATASGPAGAKEAVFREAKGEWVWCMDSHVLLHPHALERFRLWASRQPACMDLLHGALVYDDLVAASDRMEPVWRGHMFGIWGGARMEEWEAPREIPMHGMGLFGCRRDAWLGFNPAMRGFGGEEGYAHEKFRKAGRKVLCLPFMRWTHHFRKGAPPYRLTLEDRVRNYIIGWRELGLDLGPVREHFGAEMFDRVAAGL